MIKYYKLKRELIKEENDEYSEMGIASLTSSNWQGEVICGIGRYGSKPEGLKEITKEQYKEECLKKFKIVLKNNINYLKRMIIKADKDYDKWVRRFEKEMR